MRPVLFWVSSYPVPTHDFFVLLGVFAGVAVFAREAQRRAMLDDRLLVILVGSLVCGGVVARLSALWRYATVAPDPSLLEFVTRGGRSILGGLVGAYGGALVTKRLLRYGRPTGDVFAPAVALAMAIGRWGCFFTELPGTPTPVPWAVRLDGVPRHPSFLYESAFQGAMFCWLWWWGRSHVRVPGDLFKIYLLAYAVFRFLVEFVRGNDVVWAGLTRPQLFLIPATAALAVYFATRRVRGDHAALALHAGQP